jgi:plasmid maintenance system killer protein
MEIQIGVKSTRKGGEDNLVYVNVEKQHLIIMNWERKNQFAVVNVNPRQW